MRLLAVLAALTLAVAPAAPAGAPSLAASGCPLFPADSADSGSGTWESGPIGIPFTVPRQEPSGRHVRAATPGTMADPGTAPAERARATPPPR
jgi:hypothetical protein